MLRTRPPHSRIMHLRRQPRRAARRFVVDLPHRHDRGAHRRRSERHDESEQQHPERGAGGAIGEDQIAQVIGIKHSRPPTSSAATVMPMARLIANRRNSGTRRNARRWGFCSLLGTVSDIAAHLVFRQFYQRTGPSSWPGLSRPSTSSFVVCSQDVDARTRPGMTIWVGIEELDPYGATARPSVQRPARIVGIGADRSEESHARGAQPGLRDAIALHELGGDRLGAAPRQVEIVIVGTLEARAAPVCQPTCQGCARYCVGEARGILPKCTVRRSRPEALVSDQS